MSGSAQYDCGKCPGYCCSYPVIALGLRDVARLAKHFGITVAAAARRFTKTDHGERRLLRRKRDAVFGRICVLFDTEQRRCGVYAARPTICRTFLGQGQRCGYYDFLRFERRQQEDPARVIELDHGLWR